MADELFKIAERELFTYIAKTIELKNLEVEIDFLSNISFPGERAINYSDVKIQSSSNYGIEDFVISYNKNYKDLLARRYVLIKSIKKVENALELLNENEKKMVKYRYFDNLSWFHVSKKLGYSESNCKALRVKAINKIKYVIR